MVAALLLVAAAPARADAPVFPLRPAEVLKRAGTVAQKDYPGANAVVLYRGLDVAVDEDGVSDRREQVAVKLMTLAGAAARQTLRFDYDPTTSDVEISAVHVVRGDGAIEKVPTDTAADLPAPKHWIYWPFRMKLVSLPPLLPGDSVVWSTRFTGFQIAYLESSEERFVPPQRGEFYDIVTFGGEEPVLEQVYRVSLPADKNVRFGVYNGELASSMERKDRIQLAFWRRNLPAHPAEKRALAFSDSVPKVVLATIDWREKSRWFFLTNEPSFEYTEEIEQKARQIIAGKKTDRERMTALNRWVAHNIRYSGLSMGEGEGYTLHSGTMTFEDRCGVCKDKAGMLVTMMRAVGLKDTFAAMTMAGARVEDVAADQFNHCVVVWRDQKGGFVLLDPTWAPLSSYDWSYAEAEQHWVAGTATGELLQITPPLAPTDNKVQVTINATVDEDGNLEGELAATGTGYMDTCLRRWFGFAPGGEWADTFAGMARAVHPSARVTGVKLKPDDIDNLDKPLTTGFAYRADQAVPTVGSPKFSVRPASFSFPLNNERISENLIVGKAEGRKRGLSFRCAKELHYKEKLKLPAKAALTGWKDIDVANDYGSVKALVRQRGKVLNVEVHAAFATRSVPVSGLDQYQALLNALDTVRTSWVVVRRAK